MRPKGSFSSIKWKIFGAFAVFAAVMLILLWFFQVVFLESFYKATKISEIQSQAHELCQNIGQPGFSARLKSAAQERQICVIVSDSAGNRLYSEHAVQECAIHRLGPWALATIYMVAEQNDGSYFERFRWERGGAGSLELGASETGKKDTPESIVYAETVQTSQGGIMILMNSMITPVGSTVETLRLQLISVTGIMLLLAVLLAWFLSRKISRPIIGISKTAQEMASGDYSVEFDGSGYKEAFELSETLNETVQELSKVDRLQKDLIANVSHDLRTPLTLIEGYAEVMRDIPGENTPENVQIIIDETTRLSSLVNDLLDISRLQSGTLKLEKEVFSITGAVREILGRYTKLTDYSITFHAEEEILVCADKLKISQVIYNLVNNALTYTGEDKRVMLEQETDEGKVRISVTDTGEGIPQDKLLDIWERYYKVDKAHKRAQVGTGLGLSIVKTILDMHGGAYGVESQEGVGSTFWFELDITDPPSSS